MHALAHSKVVHRQGELQYQCWKIGNAELWLQTLAGEEVTAKRIIDLSPHYAGETQNEVQLQQRVVRDRDSPLDYAFIAHSQSDMCPLVFNVPVIDAEPIIPTYAKVQITAFAENINVFPSETAYEQQKKPNKGWASKALVPIGTFKPNGEKIDPPDSRAIIAGIVTETASLVNKHTDKSFQWAKLNSYLYDYDVVAGPDTCDQPLNVGNVVVGSFWLSAKLLFIENKEPEGVTAGGEQN